MPVIKLEKLPDGKWRVTDDEARKFDYATRDLANKKLRELQEKLRPKRSV